MRQELESMDRVEGLTHSEHLIQGRKARGKEKIVITVAKGTSIDTIDSAATVTLLKETEEVKAVKALSVTSENLSLTDSIADGETRRDLRVPTNVAELVNVDKDDKTQEKVISRLNIILKRMENLQNSKALDLSMEHPKTLESFLRK